MKEGLDTDVYTSLTSKKLMSKLWERLQANKDTEWSIKISLEKIKESILKIKILTLMVLQVLVINLLTVQLSFAYMILFLENQSI